MCVRRLSRREYSWWQTGHGSVEFGEVRRPRGTKRDFLDTRSTTARGADEHVGGCGGGGGGGGGGCRGGSVTGARWVG